jgi:hypothetical protein
MATFKIEIKARRVALAAIAAFVLTALCTASDALSEKKIRIQQASTLTGNFYIELNQNSFAAKDAQLSLEIYTKAPNWQVQFFNKRTHQKMTIPADKFEGSLTVHQALSEVNIKALNWKRIDEEKIAGIDTDHWCATGYTNDPKKQIVLNGIIARRIDFWLAKKGFTSPVISRLARTLYGVPELDGFPVSLMITDLVLTKKVILTTRPLNIANLNFDPPDGKGFAIAHTQRELFFVSIDSLLKDDFIKNDLLKSKW